MSSTSTSASIRFVTSAPSVSLSPKRISSVVTVSFSLMIGITSRRSSVTQRRARVEIAAAVGEVVVRQQDLRRVQPEAARTPIRTPARVPSGRRRPPPAARASPTGALSSRGACMPSAIAPDETSTTSRPRALQLGDLRPPSARRPSWSRPRPSLVTRLEPTLTTSRARGRDRRASCFASRRPRRAVGFVGRRRRGCGMRVEPVLDREDELAAAFAVDRGDREHRALPAIAP